MVTEAAMTVVLFHPQQAAAAASTKKRRLDEVCLAQHPQHSRATVQSWIAQGKVAVNGRVMTKAGAPVAPSAEVAINAETPKFVCRCAHARPTPNQVLLLHAAGS